MEAPQPGFQFAGFWWRLLATLIDSALLGVIIFLLGLGGVATTADFPNEAATVVAGHSSNVLVNWLYFAIFESSPWSATPGKRALGLVVVDAAGRRLSFLRATGRFFAKILSALPLLLGFLMAGWNRRKRALHDMIANTLVLRRVLPGEPIVPPEVLA